MPIKTCAWVRARLPLLAGGESLGLDRWVVDGHLVRCADCRHHLEALHASQAVLSAAASVNPAAPDASPLWPDLSRRLRQARRPRARTAWGFEPSRGTAWAWSLGGLAAGLLVAASLIGLGARHDRRIKELVDAYVPIAPLLSDERPRLLKPADPDQFDRRRPGPRPSPAHREAHASVTVAPPGDLGPPPTPTPNRTPAPGLDRTRPPVELTQ